MQFFFALTLLVSATLLFLIQPMFAKMVLPKLGGTPAVWNTCMVFYQAVLLAGYVYAHISTRLLGTRKQAALHLVLLCIPWLVLPIAVAQGWTPPSDANPIPWLLMLLTVSVGLPFFVVSASAPMLQVWFSDTGHPAGKDPYFLYAASNFGSMLALLGYPTLVEPFLKLVEQSWVWTLGYGALAAMTLGCAVLLWRSRGAAPAAVVRAPSASEPAASQGPELVPTWPLRLRWLALSFVPSSLLLGVTTFISTDIAAVPLLWVIPLALYLLSFVLVFAQWPLALSRAVLRAAPQQRWLANVLDPHWFFVWVQPFLMVVLVMVFFETLSEKAGWVILLHLATLFVTAMVCHGELARHRPAARYLTEFYLWMSLGGMLGGMFNALVAPLVFPLVFEYPLVIALAGMLRPGVVASRRPVLSRWLDILLPLAVFAAMYLLLCLQSGTEFQGTLARFNFEGVDWAKGMNTWLTAHLNRNVEIDAQMVILGLGAFSAFVFLLRPVRFGVAIGVVLLAGQLWFALGKDVRYLDRSFYGVMKVRRENYTYVNHRGEEERAYKHILLHGSTNHGEQRFDSEWRRKPITYYFPTGPIGEVFTRVLDPETQKEIGVCGLGTGSTAAYRRPGQRITYFEIDPHVLNIACDPRYFSYLTDSDPELKTPNAMIAIKLGDARLTIEQEPDGKFDLLLVDTFSSDAIPMHMITKEAIDLFFRKLKERGILIVHISNRHLDLAPVVGNIARELNLIARYRNDANIDLDEAAVDKFASDVVVVVRKPQYLGPLADDDQWESISPNDRVGIWTDDFSNFLTVVNWLQPTSAEVPIDELSDEEPADLQGQEVPEKTAPH